MEGRGSASASSLATAACGPSLFPLPLRLSPSSPHADQPAASSPPPHCMNRSAGCLLPAPSPRAPRHSSAQAAAHSCSRGRSWRASPRGTPGRRAPGRCSGRRARRSGASRAVCVSSLFVVGRVLAFVFARVSCKGASQSAARCNAPHRSHPHPMPAQLSSAQHSPAPAPAPAPAQRHATASRRAAHHVQRYEVVADAGHMLHHDQPEAVARLIEAFLLEGAA